jgi:hypothetical protein
MDRMRSRVAGLLLCFAPFAANAAPPDGGWDWAIAPYVWAASIGTDVRTHTPPTSASADTAFPDVVDILDGVFEVHGEGQGDAFGIFADFTYFGLADEKQRRFQRTESDLDMRLMEVAGVWSPGEARFTGLEAFAGARVIDLDYTLQFLPDNPAFAPHAIDRGQTYYDFMLGARYTWALSDRWSLTLRGDGSWGDTEGTWNASVVGQYRMRHGSWAFGYRYLDADFENAGDTLGVTLDGPVIGYAFRF